jgi:hypothetical protein
MTEKLASYDEQRRKEEELARGWLALKCWTLTTPMSIMRRQTFQFGAWNESPEPNIERWRAATQVTAFNLAKYASLSFGRGL